MSARFCHNCGSPLSENAKFCGNCGTPVPVRPPVEEAVKPAPEPEAPVIPAEEPAAPAAAPVFTLDSLDEEPPAPPAKPVIFSLDNLETEEPAPEPEPKPEPKPEPQPESVPAPMPVRAPQPEEVPTPAPAPESAPAKKEKPQKKEKPAKQPKAPKPNQGWAKRGGGRTVLAVLVCVLIFVWSFACLTLVNVRLATTGEQGQESLTALVRSLDLTKISASALNDELPDPKATVADWIVAKITENYQGRVELDPADLKEFMEDSSFPSFLVSRLGDCLTEIYTGKAAPEITAEDIKLLLQTDLALIDEIFDEQLTQEDIAYIADAAIDSGVTELLTVQSMKNRAGALVTVLQVGLSWWVIAIAGVILVLLVLLLGKVNRGVLRTFGDTGITLMVMSAIWCIGGLLILVMPDLWNAMFYQLRPVGAAIGSLLTASLIPSAAVFGAGVLMLLVKIIGKSIVIKSAKVQA